MRKIRLDVEALAVESFVAGSAAGTGTVRGHDVEDEAGSMVVGNCQTFGCIDFVKCATVGAEASCLNTVRTCGFYTCNAAAQCMSGSYCNAYSYDGACTGSACSGMAHCTGGATSCC